MRAGSSCCFADSHMPFVQVKTLWELLDDFGDSADDSLSSAVSAVPLARTLQISPLPIHATFFPNAATH